MALEREQPVSIDDGHQRSVDRLRALAHLLDEAVRVPGTRFRVGLDPVLGILPVAGDAVAAVASVYIVVVGRRLGVPPRTTLWMLLRVAVEFVAGSVPVLGPLVDAGWKVNVTNVDEIEAHLGGTPD